MMRISHSESKLKTDYEFFQLFADFSRSYPLIPSIHKDIYHLVQRIINPVVYVFKDNKQSNHLEDPSRACLLTTFQLISFYIMLTT